MGSHTEQHSFPEEYTPTIVFNDSGTPSWCGKCVEELDAANFLGLLRFCKSEGYRKGWNDSNNDRIVEDCQNPFHEELFDGFPFQEWDRSYRQGVKEHKLRFPSPDDTNKYHYFALNFSYSLENDDGYCDQYKETLYVYYLDQQITMQRIKNLKQSVNIPPHAALINASYLGYMTKEEFDTKE